jgi:outer membrane biosynthesis protein TonB
MARGDGRTVVAVSVLVLSAAVSAMAQLGVTTESSLRDLASRIVTPAFPAEALADRRTGVAVAEMELDERGGVMKVDVLEAPSESIRREMLAALRQWEFARLALVQQRVRFKSRVTFYFAIVNGSGRVLSPSEAGYLGRWPRPADQPPSGRQQGQ